MIEPYLLSHFAKQFGYDYFYVENLNIDLHFSGNLFEGARASYFYVAGGTRVMFSLPQQTPNSYTSLSFSPGML